MLALGCALHSPQQHRTTCVCHGFLGRQAAAVSSWCQVAETHVSLDPSSLPLQGLHQDPVVCLHECYAQVARLVATARQGGLDVSVEGLGLRPWIGSLGPGQLKLLGSVVGECSLCELAPLALLAEGAHVVVGM